MTQCEINQNHLRFGLAAALFLLLSTYPQLASAHNLKPHSEFTEVAYSYLNALKYCAPEQRQGEGLLVDMATCTTQCKQQFLATAGSSEWADSCYENLCDRVWVDNDEQCDLDGNCTPLPPYYKQIPDVKCYGRSGFAKHSCVDHCVQEDKSAASRVCRGSEGNY